MDLRVELIGLPRWIQDGQPVEIPGSRKTRALLGYLLLQDRPVSRESLCEVFWPIPDDPRAALRWSLAKLRPLLDWTTPDGEPVWAVDRRAVYLHGLEPVVDVRRIYALDPVTATTAELEASCEGVTGDLLDGHELPDCHRFHDWLLAERERLRRARVAVLVELVERYREDLDRAMEFAHRLHAVDPYHELYEETLSRILSSRNRPQGESSAAHAERAIEEELATERIPGAELVRRSRELERIPWFEAIPASPSARGSAGLFGRVEEARALGAFLDDLEAGESVPVLLFEGEPGIGKTRLLEELQRRSASRRVRVVRARSWEAEMIRPYGPWQDLLQSAEQDALDENDRQDLAALLSADTPDTSLDEGRLYRAVTRWVEGLVDDGGSVALAFDDLQWMDNASAALLHYVSRNVSERVGIVCTGRSGELAEDGAVRAVLRAWSRDGRLARVAVERLSEEDAAALARSMAPDADVKEVVARCGGNPLYLIECCRALDQPLPTAVQQLLHDRFEALSMCGRVFAGWVAILGRAARVEWMDELTDASPQLLREGAAELRERGILVIENGRCDFAHDLMRQTVSAALGAYERRSMHHQVANALEARATESEEIAVDLAHHASKSERWRLAATAGLRAAERALRLAAPGEARDLARRALRDLAHESLDADGALLQAQLYRVMVHAGLGRQDAAWLQAELEALVTSARRLGAAAAERMAFYLLSILAEEAGDFRRAQDHTLSAEAAGRSADDWTRLAALSNTSRCLLQLEREPRRARELLEEAEALSAHMGESVLDLPWARGLLGALEQEPEVARPALQRGAEQARAVDSHWARFECLAALSKLDLEDGDCDAIVTRHSELLEVARQLGDGTERVFAECLLALAEARSQSSDAADAALENALTRLRHADTKGRLAYALNAAAELDLERGAWLRARSRASEALEAATVVGRPLQVARARAIVGLVALATQQVRAAREQADHLEAELRGWGPHPAARAQLLRLRRALQNVKEGEAS